MIFYEISRSFIYTNRLGFIESLNDTHDINVENLKIVTFDMAYESVTLSLLNSHVFKYVEYIYLSGIITEIDKDVFKSLKNIKMLYLNVDNFGRFFSQGLTWTTYLNLNTSSTKLYVVFHDEYSPFKNVYEYPDVDICLFKDFPFERSVYPSLFLGKTQLECSCTLIWLIQYTRYYLNFDYTDYLDAQTISHLDLSQANTPKHCLGRQKLSTSFRACQFQVKFNKCLTSGYMPKTLFEFRGEHNLKLIYSTLQFIMKIYIQPILCTIAILTNSLTIIIVRNRNTRDLTKNLNNMMYKHLQVNAWLIILYSSLKLISLLNTCILPFCSTIYTSPSSQYIKIYLIFLLGNALRLSTNCSYIGFTISRYLATTSTDSNKYLQKFDNINLKLFYSTIIVTSLALSVYQGFQFKVNDTYYDLNYPFDTYSVTYCLNVNVKRSAAFYTKCNLFATLTMINNILNNIVFFLLGFVVDMGLFRFAGQNLKRKKRLFHNEENRLIQALKLKEKINKIIFTNGLLFFLSHLPEFVVTFLLIVFGNVLERYCMYLFSCVEFIEMAQVFSFFSFSLQFFAFKHFDRNFADSFENLMRRIFKLKK